MCKTLLMPPTPIVVSGVPVTAALMVWAFALGGQESPFSYAAYVISAYSLVILIVAIARSSLVARIADFVRSFGLAAQLIDDRHFRLEVGMHSALLVDGMWAITNLAMGAVMASAWFVTLAAYYLALTAMRAIMVRHIRRRDFEGDPVAEHRACRTCGIVLASSAVALSGMVVLVLHSEGGFSYAGTLIFAAAAYAFYSLVMNIVGFVRNRKGARPVLAASIDVNLATALVSIFALEVAMFASFGGDGAQDAAFQFGMTAGSGAAICLMVLAIGVLMAARSSKALREVEKR